MTQEVATIAGSADQLNVSRDNGGAEDAAGGVDAEGESVVLAVGAAEAVVKLHVRFWALPWSPKMTVAV
jgi:hypothetical protein